ncbi:MAG: hypothetical protein ACK5MA_09105 [Parachlamydiaceae bacterium]
MKFYLIFLFCLSSLWLSAEENLIQNQLKKGRKGDYVVVAQGKCLTLFHIFDKSNNALLLEEVAIPSQKAEFAVQSWKEWMAQGAPYHSSWILYELDLQNREIKRYYSFTKRSYFTLAEGDNFLFTLLHLNLQEIPLAQRKKVGLEPRGNQPDRRKPWAPKIIFEGHEVPDVSFNAYSARWPEDGTPLSNKLIEIYLPEENSRYPSYFPYWLQVRGVIGPSKVRVVDSGEQLASPQKGFP